MISPIGPFAASRPLATVSSSEAGWPAAIWRRPFSVEPASTIMMSISPLVFRRPATVRSKTHSSSSWYVGLMIHSPSFRPRITPPMGPSNGMPLIISAADAPLSEIIS